MTGLCDQADPANWASQEDLQELMQQVFSNTEGEEDIEIEGNDALEASIEHYTHSDGSLEPARKRPPRPQNAFMIFGRVRRRELQQQHPDLANIRISQILGHEWKVMNAEMKAMYFAMAKKTREDFFKEYPDYKYTRRPNRNKKRKPTKGKKDSPDPPDDSEAMLGNQSQVGWAMSVSTEDSNTLFHQTPGECLFQNTMDVSAMDMMAPEQSAWAMQQPLSSALEQGQSDTVEIESSDPFENLSASEQVALAEQSFTKYQLRLIKKMSQSRALQTLAAGQAQPDVQLNLPSPNAGDNCTLNQSGFFQFQVPSGNHSQHMHHMMSGQDELLSPVQTPGTYLSSVGQSLQSSLVSSPATSVPNSRCTSFRYPGYAPWPAACCPDDRMYSSTQHATVFNLPGLAPPAPPIDVPTSAPSPALFDLSRSNSNPMQCVSEQAENSPRKAHVPQALTFSPLLSTKTPQPQPPPASSPLLHRCDSAPKPQSAFLQLFGSLSPRNCPAKQQQQQHSLFHLPHAAAHSASDSGCSDAAISSSSVARLMCGPAAEERMLLANSNGTDSNINPLKRRLSTTGGATQQGMHLWDAQVKTEGMRAFTAVPQQERSSASTIRVGRRHSTGGDIDVGMNAHAVNAFTQSHAMQSRRSSLTTAPVDGAASPSCMFPFMAVPDAPCVGQQHGQMNGMQMMTGAPHPARPRSAPLCDSTALMENAELWQLQMHMANGTLPSPALLAQLGLLGTCPQPV